MYYAGIGHRDITREAWDRCKRFAQLAARHDFILRSGGAKGADSAFADGARSASSQIFRPEETYPKLVEYAMAQTLDPGISFARMKPYVKALICRNYYQIMGKDGEPSTFVACWSRAENPADRSGGGTRYAVRLAISQGIPVYNLRKIADCNLIFERLKAFEQTGVF